MINQVRNNHSTRPEMFRLSMSTLDQVSGGMTVSEFQALYPDKAARENALLQMSNEEIDEIIASCGTPQGKAYYASFKK